MNDAVVSEWVSTGGSKVAGFEEALAEYVGMPRAVACNSGTSGCTWPAWRPAWAGATRCLPPHADLYRGGEPHPLCGGRTGVHRLRRQPVHGPGRGRGVLRSAVPYGGRQADPTAPPAPT